MTLAYLNGYVVARLFIDIIIFIDSDYDIMIYPSILLNILERIFKDSKKIKGSKEIRE
jgi:hypothetical protein